MSMVPSDVRIAHAETHLVPIVEHLHRLCGALLPNQCGKRIYLLSGHVLRRGRPRPTELEPAKQIRVRQLCCGLDVSLGHGGISLLQVTTAATHTSSDLIACRRLAVSVPIIPCSSPTTAPLLQLYPLSHEIATEAVCCCLSKLPVGRRFGPV